MSKRTALLYIEDIKDSIRKIEQYTKSLTFEKFTNDGKTIDAVIRNISVIGEAVKNIPSAVKSKYPDIPWREIESMRNKIIHEYFGVSEDILWKTIKEDMLVLKKQIKNIKI